MLLQHSMSVSPPYSTTTTAATTPVFETGSTEGISFTQPLPQNLRLVDEVPLLLVCYSTFSVTVQYQTRTPYSLTHLVFLSLVFFDNFCTIVTQVMVKKSGTCCSTSYVSLDQKRSTILKVAANWQDLMHHAAVRCPC